LDKGIAGLETVLKEPRDKLSISSLENQEINAAITRSKNLLDENHQHESDVLENHSKELNSMYPLRFVVFLFYMQ
jgi:hypothetical protein